jgi:putative alpha-1,2-mannosidase
MYFDFKTGESEKIKIKFALSSVSQDNALANMQAEIKDWDFEKVKAIAQQLWNAELNKIQVEGGGPSSSQQSALSDAGTVNSPYGPAPAGKKIKPIDYAGIKQTIFYTALYHSMLAPNVYSDIDGQYRGMDQQVHTAQDFNYYTVFSLWDTYRGAHPLFTLLQTERVNDMVRSMLAIYQQQGKLPVWHLMGNETNCMPGNSAFPVIADAYLKGFDGFDANLALDTPDQVDRELARAAARSVRHRDVRGSKRGQIGDRREEATDALLVLRREEFEGDGRAFATELFHNPHSERPTVAVTR